MANPITFKMTIIFKNGDPLVHRWNRLSDLFRFITQYNSGALGRDNYEFDVFRVYKYVHSEERYVCVIAKNKDSVIMIDPADYIYWPN